MKTTAPNLIRLSGLSAIAAGILFVMVGLLHPANVPASIMSSLRAPVHVIAFAVSLFGVLGITGIYARQAEEAGWLGLTGFVLSASGSCSSPASSSSRPWCCRC